MGGPGSGRQPGELVITDRLRRLLQEKPEDAPVRETKADFIALRWYEEVKNKKSHSRWKALAEMLWRLEGPLRDDDPRGEQESPFDPAMLSDDDLEILEKLVNSSKRGQPQEAQIVRPELTDGLS